MRFTWLNQGEPHEPDGTRRSKNASLTGKAKRDQTQRSQLQHKNNDPFSPFSKYAARDSFRFWQVRMCEILCSDFANQIIGRLMRIGFITFACILIGCSSNAGAAVDMRVAVSEADCRRIVAISADKDAAAYQPGVDVRGRAVVPADLTPAVKLGQADIDLQLDIPLRLLRPDLQRIYRGIDIALGQLRYNAATGTMSLNGQRLESKATHHIVVQCRDRLKK